MPKSDVRERELPSVADALAAVARDADDEGFEIHRISIRVQPSGEVVYRLHAREDDAPLGGIVRLPK